MKIADSIHEIRRKLIYTKGPEIAYLTILENDYMLCKHLCISCYYPHGIALEKPPDQRSEY